MVTVTRLVPRVTAFPKLKLAVWNKEEVNKYNTTCNERSLSGLLRQRTLDLIYLVLLVVMVMA